MSTEDIKATVPITVTVDLQELLIANVGEIPPYTGDPDDEWEPPTPMIGAIVNAVAAHMAWTLKNDATGYNGMKHAIRTAIDEKIAEIVTEQLEREFLPVDSYGEVIRHAEPITLREQIKKQASDALAKGLAPSSQYSNNASQGAIKKYIDTEIDKLIKAELLKEVEAAKQQVVAKVRANAAQVITDTVARSVR